MATYKVLGTDDSVNTCDCCGRSDLKDTVALEDEEGNVVFFGCVCAAKATKRLAKDIRKDAKTADKAKADAERNERYAAEAAEKIKWCAFLLRAAGSMPDWDGRQNTFKQIEALGGYTKARALYLAEGK